MSSLPLPLFPLPTVLFPGQVLPLYVFEERYRALLRRVQASGEPFGVVYIERSSRDSAAPLHERVSGVGTLAHLMQTEQHEDGTSSILVVGGERFRIAGLSFGEPYLMASAELWPLPLPERGTAEYTEQCAAALLAGMQRSWPERAAVLRQEAPADPLLLASYAASLLCALSADRAAPACNVALAAPTLLERLELLLAALPATPATDSAALH